jgi:hypothetical protein
MLDCIINDLIDGRLVLAVYEFWVEEHLGSQESLISYVTVVFFFGEWIDSIVFLEFARLLE